MLAFLIERVRNSEYHIPEWRSTNESMSSTKRPRPTIRRENGDEILGPLEHEREPARMRPNHRVDRAAQDDDEIEWEEDYDMNGMEIPVSEEPIAWKLLPAPVRTSVEAVMQTKSPYNCFKLLRGDTVAYIVEGPDVNDPNMMMALTMAPTGAVIELTRVTRSVDSLPEYVRQAIMKNYPLFEMVEAEAVTMNFFEVLYQTPDGIARIMQIDSSGFVFNDELA